MKYNDTRNIDLSSGYKTLPLLLILMFVSVSFTQVSGHPIRNDNACQIKISTPVLVFMFGSVPVRQLNEFRLQYTGSHFMHKMIS